jgi:MFS family permease
MLALNRNVAVLSGTVFLFVGAWFSWYPILPLHLRDLGATDAQVGLAYTLMQLGYQGMQLLGGLLADVRDGKVTLKSAREDYKVVIDPETLAVAEEATKQLRMS